MGNIGYLDQGKSLQPLWIPPRVGDYIIFPGGNDDPYLVTRVDEVSGGMLVLNLRTRGKQRMVFPPTPFLHTIPSALTVSLIGLECKTTFADMKIFGVISDETYHNECGQLEKIVVEHEKGWFSKLPSEVTLTGKTRQLKGRSS